MKTPKFKLWNFREATMLGPFTLQEIHESKKPIDWDFVIPLSFTGCVIKKTGEEIYEGDVITYWGKKNKKNHLFKAVVIEKKSFFTINENQSILHDWAVLQIALELKGNIYLTPELMPLYTPEKLAIR